MAQKLLSLYSSLHKLATNFISKQTVLHLAPFKLQTKLFKLLYTWKRVKENKAIVSINFGGQN